ncbi:MAG: radical SAM family heme chaperone HemW [Bacilli bacterium]
MNLFDQKAKSIYIHIPFCSSICSYCDFIKIQYFPFLADQYISALEKEFILLNIPDEIETIYVGGGTPTVLSIEQLERLLKIIFPYTKHVKEYTFEANPESIDEQKAILLKKYGVNRISIGVESTDDKILKTLNRKHCFSDVISITKLLRDFGFDNINFDLILGLPNTTNKMLKKDIESLLKLNPDHISCYSLSVHPNTIFYNRGIKEIDENSSFDQYQLINEILENNGYIHYEVSNWAKKNKESIHNYVYWDNKHYYGIGVAASGYINNIRYTNTKSITDYINGKTKDEIEEISLMDEYEYQIMLSFRTLHGLDLTYLKNRFAKDLLKENEETINQLIKNNYIYKDNNRLVPTFKGMMNVDYIVLELIK